MISHNNESGGKVMPHNNKSEAQNFSDDPSWGGKRPLIYPKEYWPSNFLTLGDP